MTIYLVNSDNNVKHNIKTSLATGAVAAGIQTLILPSEAKEALKYSVLGEDSFVRNAQEKAKKLAEQTNETVDMAKLTQSIKKAFPQIKEYAAQIGKSIAGTFGFVALTLFVCRFVEDKIYSLEQEQEFKKAA